MTPRTFGYLPDLRDFLHICATMSAISRRPLCCYQRHFAQKNCNKTFDSCTFSSFQVLKRLLSLLIFGEGKCKNFSANIPVTKHVDICLKSPPKLDELFRPSRFALRRKNLFFFFLFFGGRSLKIGGENVHVGFSFLKKAGNH